MIPTVAKDATLGGSSSAKSSCTWESAAIAAATAPRAGWFLGGLLRDAAPPCAASLALFASNIACNAPLRATYPGGASSGFLMKQRSSECRVSPQYVHLGPPRPPPEPVAPAQPLPPIPDPPGRWGRFDPPSPDGPNPPSACAAALARPDACVARAISCSNMGPSSPKVASADFFALLRRALQLAVSWDMLYPWCVQ